MLAAGCHHCARVGTRASCKHSHSLRSPHKSRGGLANNVRETSRLTCKSSSALASGSQSDELRSPEELRQSELDIGANTMKIESVATKAGAAICDALSRTISSRTIWPCVETVHHDG